MFVKEGVKNGKFKFFWIIGIIEKIAIIPMIIPSNDPYNPIYKDSYIIILDNFFFDAPNILKILSSFFLSFKIVENTTAKRIVDIIQITKMEI